MVIFIDDERTRPGTIICRNYDSAIKTIENFTGGDLIVDFDHDLGEAKTGYDVAVYIVNNNINCKFHIHSMNPVGAFNIRQLLTHYGYEEVYDYA